MALKNRESVTWFAADGATRDGPAGILPTLKVQGTADDFLASCRLAAECSPAYTVKVAGITVGHCGGFIGAGLLFEIHQRSHRGRSKERGGKGD